MLDKNITEFDQRKKDHTENQLNTFMDVCLDILGDNKMSKSDLITEILTLIVTVKCFFFI